MNRSPTHKPQSTVHSQDSGLRTQDFPEPVYDCWKIIGVGGNGSCRELPRFVHCRNCPVYSAAALQLLDRPATDEYRREWSEHYARERKLTTPAKTSVVIFRIGPEWLALPTQAFQEVAERRAVHSLPHRRGGVVLGLVNVRGELLICASLGRLLGVPSPQSTVRSPQSGTQDSRLRTQDYLLVANWDGNRIAFPVDEVHGIQRVHQDEMREPPATVAKSTHTYSRGVFAWPVPSESRVQSPQSPVRDSGLRTQNSGLRTVGLLDADVLFAGLNRSLS